MKFLMLLTSFFAYSVLAETHREIHREVKVNEEVAGTLTPAAITTCGRVLILHGYQDHRDGVGNVQKLLAEHLSEVGIESLRIDFRGEGERNGYRVTSTIDGRIADAEASYTTLTQDGSLPTGVFGFSLGGMTAMLLAAKHPEWFDTMVVWSAAGTGGSNLVSGDADMNQAIRQAVKTGEAQIESWTTMTITREFILSFLGVNVLDSLQNYPGSFLSIRGDRDFLPADEKQWIQKLSNPDVSYRIVKGGDHIFNVLEPGSALHQGVIQQTADWYQSRLCQ